MERWPHRLLVVPLGVAIYLNFFTHHFVADLRWFLILAVDRGKPGDIPGARAYPNQREHWELLHIAKINAWFLLSIIGFLPVAQWKLRTMRTEPSPPSP